MKKTYKLITAFIVLLSFVTLKMGAQISGVVTINNTLPVSSTNYTSFTQLATTLNTGGINGPLTVNVGGTGPYTEQVTFNNITGTSATNTITINGNGYLLTYNASSSGAHTMWLNGASYVSVNNLQMQGTNATYAMVLIFSNHANYNNFSACTFSCPANGTGSYQIPVSWSSSNTFASSGGDCGNFNAFKTCTLSSGYYAIFHYALTSAPFTHDNSFINCRITDWYVYCLYGYYAKNLTIKGCMFDRDTRTTFSTTYLALLEYNEGLMFDGNTIRDLWNMNQTYSGTCYMFYYTGVAAADLTLRNTIRNNVIKNMNWNGTIYGFYYNYYGNNDIYHNTFSFDNTTSTTANLYLFYYSYSSGGTGPGNTIYNNNYSLTQAGTGTKYIYYSPSNPMTSYMNYNNYNVTSTNAYIGYITSAVTPLPAWQSQTGVDANSYTFNPVFANLSTGDLHPTNVSMNNLGTPLNLPYDVVNAPRSQLTPDIGAYEFLSNNCVSTPTGLSVYSPTYAICPNNSANLNVNGYTSDIGVVYQWLSSTTSSVGPWTLISGANSVLYTTPSLTNTTYYGVAVTCTNAGITTTVANVVNIAGTTTSLVPYLENFEGITGTNKLPNCSWSASSLGGTCLTYTSSNTLGRIPHSGNSFASFYYSPAGVNYYYTNGIYLNAGVTYSASLWFETEYYGYNNWTDLSILYGPNQNTTGLIPIASTNGPAVSNVYKLLSNTFTVATSGLYYVAVRGTAVSGSANYLSWDDLAITIPCSVNSPTIALTANSTTICGGNPVILTAVGADTYTWNTGANTNAITDMPSITTNYYVIGTSSLSGCTSTITQMVFVNPAPTVLVFVNNATVCAGQAVNLTGLGASSYTWSTGSNNNVLTVSPTANITYTVLGSNSNGCAGIATQAISVNALPTINVTSSQPNIMCSGETQVLTATGGVSYVWTSTSGSVMQGSPININPTSTTVYTVTGTNANGCSNKSTITQNVSDCLGLKENKSGSVRIYPNPTTGEFTVELNNTSEKIVEVMDLTGRIISSSTGSQESVTVNIANLANGIYYVKIQSSNTVDVVKIVKQ
jgi:hypothetical protein